MKRIHQPKIKIINKRWGELTWKERRSCASLTYRKGGLMCVQLDKPENMVYLAIDERTGSLVGWALEFKTVFDDICPNVYLYVRKTQRRKGIGTMLINAVKSNVPTDIYVYPHDDASYAFFDKNIKRLVYD